VSNIVVKNNTAHNAGGGIEVIFQAQVVFEDCHVSKNRAVSKGGGIVMYDSKVDLKNCHFSYVAHDKAQAILGSHMLVLTRSLFVGFSNNTATSAAGISVQEFSSLTISNCTISHNRAAAGAAGLGISEFGVLSVLDCLFYRNRGFTGNGGAITVVEFAKLNIENTTFCGNVAKAGGAVYSSSYERAIIGNCTFLENEASGGSGGGLMLVNSSAIISQCSFSYVPTTIV
jgi:predicted outer membrane repeat protein